MSEPAVRLQRRYPHAAEKVFAAFASADAIARWLSPADDIVLRVERFQFAVEGAYLFHYHDSSGAVASLAGQFLTIDPPHRLSMSWRWLPPDIHADIESIVLVTIVDAEGGSLLTVEHERLTGQAMPARHAAGWTGALARLDQFLAATKGEQE
jgi:uncharacterized protein YndB with AHSA1/START domain